MKRWNLKIKLKSDLCVATGEDAPGITNCKTALEHGIPYIPAKRIKGCLVNEGKEMRDNGFAKQGVLERVFGKTGAERSEGICISDAHLKFAPAYLFGGVNEEPIEIADYKLFQKEVQKSQREGHGSFEEFFTRMRTRTAIDPNTRTARKHSLRTIQVVPAGVHFVCRIEGDLNEKEEEVLQNCVKGLRHIGMEITRGLGEVQCELEESVSTGDSILINSKPVLDKNAILRDKYQPKEEVVLSYEVTLDLPLMIEGTGNCLPGGIMLGALAGMYIKKYSLGGDAHTDEYFRRIFLRDGVQFGYAFPKRNNHTYFPCPKAIAKMKEDEGEWFHIEGNVTRKRKEIHGFVRWEDETLHIISPYKEIHFHHSRPVNRGIGHALNDKAENTSIPTGEFFQYTVLSKGQTFAGTWRGQARDIQRLVECLQENHYRIRLGKSKTAEYGNCTFRIMEIQKKESESQSTRCGKEWMLWFLTPMISREEQTGEYTLEESVLKEQLKEKLKCDVQLRKVACSYTTYSGYNSKWRLPSVACPAIDAGSTYYLSTNREIPICEIENNLWGAVIGNGCGQAAVRPWNEKEEGAIVFDPDEVNEVEISDDSPVNRLLRLQRERFGYVSEVIEQLKSQSEESLPPSSAISLLAQLLRTYANEDDFYEKIEEHVKRIKKVEKKQRMLRLIEPCKGKTSEFMKLYLENAKWKARCESRDA